MKNRIFLLACIHFDLDIIKFIWHPDKISYHSQYNGFASVVGRNNIKNVKILYNLGVKYNKKSIYIATKKNFIDILNFLLEKK
jgi:hypothetical protein